MEKSPEYIQSLEKVRKEKSRESAELFRMECLFDNAELAMMLTQRLEANPTASKEEFIKLAEDSHKIIHPQATEEFINDLVETRNEVEQAIEQLKKDAGNKKIGLGKQLYRWVLPYMPRAKDHWPEGKVSVDRSYPLALILYVPNEQDFQKIDEHKNIGGFYRREHAIEWSYKEIKFPLIAVKGPGPQEFLGRFLTSHTVEHERGHAENTQTRDSLKQARRKTVWGSLTGKYSLAELRNKQTDPEQLRNSDSYKNVLSIALAEAKDELLAELVADGSHDFSKYLEHLKKKQGNYDYFELLCAFKPDDPCYKMLWDDYEKILEKSVAAAEKIVLAYESFPCGMRRLKLFRWVLAQIPIEEWPRQLEGAQFIKEAEKMEEANQIMRRISKFDSPQFKLSEKYWDLFFQNQDKPLLKILDQFLEEYKNGKID